MLDGFSIHDADNARTVVSSDHPTGHVSDYGKCNVPKERRPGIPQREHGQHDELTHVSPLCSLAFRDETCHSTVDCGR
jgi:hypothetical protein